MPPVLRNYKLDSLTKLRLCSVEVTRKALEYVLSACPLLESLYISMSHVMNCKISSPSLKLKHFKVFSCVLESLDIYAENLVSFKYLGVVEKISFKYTPQPFARPHACYIIKSLFQPPSYIFQLETIVLDIGTEVSI